MLILPSLIFASLWRKKNVIKIACIYFLLTFISYNKLWCLFLKTILNIAICRFFSMFCINTYKYSLPLSMYTWNDCHFIDKFLFKKNMFHNKKKSSKHLRIRVVFININPMIWTYLKKTLEKYFLYCSARENSSI